MPVTDKFKENMLKFGKQISVKITFDNNLIFEKEHIYSCTKSFDGSLFKTVMQFVDIELEGSVSVRDRTFLLEFGVKAENNESYEYVNWGRYIVDNDSIERKIEKNTISFTAYDYLKFSSTLYEELNIEYPTTLRKFLSSLCHKLDYQLVTENFANADTVLYDDRFIGVLKYTNRDVLDHIAGAAGGIIMLKGKKLYIKYPEETNYTLNRSNLKSLSVASKFGPLNRLALSIQDDVFKVQDKESIKQNGITEAEFINNAIVNSSRGDFSPELFSKVLGLDFYQFQLESFGYGFLEPLDIITINDADKTYKSIVLSDTITVTTGISETIQTQIDNPLVLDYTKTNNVQDLIKDTTQNLQDAVYYYTNENSVQITSTNLELINIRFTSKLEATPLFNASIVMKIDTPGLLEFTYILDNVEFYVHPKQTVLSGWCTLHLFLPFYQLEGNMSHDLLVFIKSDDATGNVSRNQIQATINGQGLEVIKDDWDGTIQIINEINPITIANINNTNMIINGIGTSLDIKNIQPSGFNLLNEMQPISIDSYGPFVTLKGIETGTGYSEVVVDEQIKFNYMTKQNFIYDSKYVSFNNGVSLITNYVFDEVTQIDIDSGKLQELSINLDQFKNVENILLEET